MLKHVPTSGCHQLPTSGRPMIGAEKEIDTEPGWTKGWLGGINDSIDGWRRDEWIIDG